MANVVGSKFQIVIDREARKKLGIEPGAVAIQRVVGDRLEIQFLPPEHNRSLAGVLKREGRPPVEDLESASEEAFELEMRDKVHGWS
jgi:bifunctional DNA-binding transcriptional regulator/antitoxin component of YhaV-PrlF toxin-antitoxin module